MRYKGHHVGELRRSVRAHLPGHRGQHRDRPGHGHRPGRAGRQGLRGLPLGGEGPGRGRGHLGRHGEQRGRVPPAGPGGPGLGPQVRGGVPGPGGAAARADQQRGRGRGAGPHQGWLRADLRHQPPRPLRADGGAAGLPRRQRAGQGGHRVQRRPLPGRGHRLRGGPPSHGDLDRAARVRRLQAGQRAVQPGARPPRGGARHHDLRPAPGSGRLGHLAADPLAGPPADEAANALTGAGRGDLAVLRHRAGTGRGERPLL